MTSSAAFNLLQFSTKPNWYDLLGLVDAAMAAEDRVYQIRWAAGWDCDEGGWWSHTGIHESEWEHELGNPFPEEPTYAAWLEANP